MMLMFGANGNPTAYYLCGKHEGKIGMLMGPSTFIKPRSWMPFALDNDAFICFTQKIEWDEPKWIAMLEKVKASGHKPRWCAVPDVVMDPVATLRNWDKYAPVVFGMGFTLAFVCQNGHKPSDVPKEAQVVFIGGDTKWKYQSLPGWCDQFQRVHVGRVNEVWRFERLEELGVESCDGSGWFRDTDEGRRIKSVKAWLEGKDFTQEIFAL
jgi:hypothetical protein